MESACLRQTALPHTSRLFEDYTYHFDRVRRFYAHDPHDAESFRRAAEGIRFDAARRAALVDALREQNGESATLDLMARPQTVAVVTGQQVGLFSGPCYTIYKALTAVRLARRLTEAGISAVPVFWLATEDHDFEEVNQCWVFDAANQPRRLRLAGANGERRPVGEIPVGAAPVDELRDALRDLPFCDEVVAMVAETYTPEATLGSAFAALLRRLPVMSELLYFDPMHAASRRLAAPLLADAVRRGPELTSRVLERDRELTDAGYHVQVHVEAQTSFVFLLENGRRVTLRRDGAEYVADGRRISAEELAARAESLSPNALLRPVVQDSMLPTVAYVGGPAELAYFAQSRVIYDALVGRAPVAVGRQSATLLTGRAGKLMERYGLELPDLFGGDEAVREKIARKLVPAGLERAVGEARGELSTLLDRLGGSLGGFDPTLSAAFENSRRKIAFQLAKTERKAAREALRRDARASAEAAYLSGLVFPEKHLQERLYSIIPFLARHGTELVGTIAEELAPDCPDHRILVV